MQKKQTAIEWLYTVLHGSGYLNQKPQIGSVSGIDVLKIVNQAKQKEKEQRANLIYHCLGDFAAKHNIVIDGRDVSKWVEENIYNEK